MVNAGRAFAQEPPHRPLIDMERVVEDFRWRYAERNKTDQVVLYCADAPSWKQAVWRAVKSRDANGKHHNHQSKVMLTARIEFGQKIIDLANDDLWDRLLAAKKRMKFDILHDRLESLNVYGIGPVTVYDVATRIGAYFEIKPYSVYMHAGVREGMRVLEAALWPGDDMYKWKRVPMDVFHSVFMVPFGVSADEMEDILCTYREVFKEWGSRV